MKNKWYRKHFSLRQILIILLVGSLGFVAYQNFGSLEWLTLKRTDSKSETQVPKYFDYGVLIDSTYCNDFFNFSISISKGHQADYQQYDYHSINSLEKDSVIAEPRLASEIQKHDLLIITPVLIKVDMEETFKKTGSVKDWMDYNKAKHKRESVGPDYSAVIRVERLSGQSVERYASQFSNMHNPNYGGKHTKIIAGKPFVAYEGQEVQNSVAESMVLGFMGGEYKKINSFMTEINDFAVSINLFYQTDEQKAMLLEMVDTITFH